MTSDQLEHCGTNAEDSVLLPSNNQLIENLHAYVKNLLDAKQLPDIEVNTDEILLWPISSESSPGMPTEEDLTGLRLGDRVNVSSREIQIHPTLKRRRIYPAQLGRSPRESINPSLDLTVPWRNSNFEMSRNYWYQQQTNCANGGLAGFISQDFAYHPDVGPGSMDIDRRYMRQPLPPLRPQFLNREIYLNKANQLHTNFVPLNGNLLQNSSTSSTVIGANSNCVSDHNFNNQAFSGPNNLCFTLQHDIRPAKIGADMGCTTTRPSLPPLLVPKNQNLRSPVETEGKAPADPVNWIDRNGPTQPMRTRTKATKKQKEIMENYFTNVKKYPSGVEMAQLAETTGLPLEYVRNWFYNRRKRRPASNNIPANKWL